MYCMYDHAKVCVRMYVLVYVRMHINMCMCVVYAGLVFPASGGAEAEAGE